MKIDYDVHHETENQHDNHVPAPSCWPWLLLLCCILAATAAWLHVQGIIQLKPASASSALSEQASTSKPVQTSSTTTSLVDNSGQQTQVSELKTSLSDLQEKLASLEHEQIKIKRERAIQESTNRALQKKLLESENKFSITRKKLLVYNEILSPYSHKRGLRIRYFSLRHDAEDNPNPLRYQYHLILSYDASGDKTLQGRYDITFNGTEAEAAKYYTLTDLAHTRTGNVAKTMQDFSIKYYHSIEGTITLPKGFQPKNVVVKLSSQHPSIKQPITQKRSWAKLMNNLSN